MRKKILSMVLAAALMLSMTAVPAAAAGSNEFADTKGHWAENVIGQWSQYEVVQGDGNGKFRPEASMTRGEFATAVVNLLGLTYKTNYHVFTDLEGDEWYAEPILKLHKAGIMKGDESKRSNPNARISREEAFVMIGRALGIEPKANADFSGYDDAGTVSNWAKPMMAAMVEEGYVKGVTASTLRPESNINRASVMQVFSNTVTTYVTEPGTYTAPDKGFVVVKAAEGKVTIKGGADGVIVGQSSKGTELTLDSAAISGSVKVDAPDVTVNVKDSKVEGTVEITAQADGATLEVAAGSTVENVATEADKVAVKGEGQVKKVEVNGGDKVEVATPGTTVKVDEAAKDSTVTAGGETVKPGESGTTSGTPDGFAEPEPTPDTPSGGGAVTPSGTTSSIGKNIVASPALPNGLASVPELRAMTLSYTLTGTTIKASGTLVKATGFEGFSNITEEQSGYYALFRLPVNDDVKAAVDAASTGTIMKSSGGLHSEKEWTADGDGSSETALNGKTLIEGTMGNYYIELLCRVAADAQTPAASRFTFTFDWDGSGTKYRSAQYTVDFSGVTLLKNAPLGGEIAKMTDPDFSGNQAIVTVSEDKKTITFGGTIAWDPANGDVEGANRVGVEITPPADFPKEGLSSGTLDGKPMDYQELQDSRWGIQVKKPGETHVFKIAWVPGYEETFTVKVDQDATLEAAPEVVDPAKPSVATMDISTSDSLYGKGASDLVTGVALGTAETSGNTVTYKPAATGTMKYVTGYTGFSTATEEQYGYYLPFDIVKPSEVPAPGIDTPVLKFYGINSGTETVAKTFTYSEFNDGHFFMVARVMGQDKSIKFELDWDGNGEEYAPTTYTISMENLTFDAAPAGAIAQDGGYTGGTEPDCKTDISGSTITFSGKIAYYTSAQAIGNEEGNRVGVAITAPAGITPHQDITSAVIGGTTYSWSQLIADGKPNGAEGFHWYQRVTEAGQEFTATVTWAPGCVQTFTIKIADDATLDPKPADPNKLGEVNAANLHDTARLYQDNDLATITTTSSEINAQNVVEFNIKAENLKYHQNGNTPKDLGYWIGAAVTVPQGVNVNGAKFAAALTQDGAVLPAEVSPLTAPEDTVHGNELGCAVYLDFLKYENIAEQGIWLQVQWFQDNTAIDVPVYYHVTFRGTTTVKSKKSYVGDLLAGTVKPEWTGAPEVGYTTLKYERQSDGTSFQARGTLYKVTNFDGFQVPGKNEGYFALFRIPVSEEAYQSVRGSTGTIFTLNGNSTKTWDKDADSDGNMGCIIEGEENDRYIEMYLRVEDADATTGAISNKTVTFEADWDGNENSYTGTTYTLVLDGVVLDAGSPTA